MAIGSYNEKHGQRQRHSRKWFDVMIVVGVLFAFFGQSSNAQVASPPPGTVRINSIQAMGTGCLPGTIFTQNITVDRLTLSYSGYNAEVGEGVPAVDARKTCNIILDIAYPSEFTFAISTVSFKGNANLDTGTVGTLAAQYFFQGQSPQVEFVQQSTGPFIGNYETPDLAPTPTSGPVMFGPCGGSGALNINTEVRVQGIGTMTADTTTDLFQQIYTFVWKQC